jgi:hypothetical protein
VYYNAQVNGLPALIFETFQGRKFDLTTAIPGTGPWTVIAVMNGTNPGYGMTGLGSSTTTFLAVPLLEATSHNLYVAAGAAGYTAFGTWDTSLSFHIYAATSTPAMFVDGVARTAGALVAGSAGNFDRIGMRSGEYGQGNIAELMIYDHVLTTTDRQNVEAYLKTKYAIP